MKLNELEHKILKRLQKVEPSQWKENDGEYFTSIDIFNFKGFQISYKIAY